MAATYAGAIGEDSTRSKECHRLGSQRATGIAKTWRTVTTCHVRRDGSGYVEVKRDGKVLHFYAFDPEDGVKG